MAQEAGTLAEHSARRTAEEARLLEERLAQEKAAGQTRGQAVAASAATLLDQAEMKAAEAVRESARELNAKSRAEEKDRYLRDYLEPKKKLGLMERLRRGLTKKQIDKDIKDVTAERTAWRTEEGEARTAARDAKVEAWALIRTSKLAEQFRDVDATKFAPDDVTTVTERLATMRGQLPDIELRIDRRDAQKLTRLQGEATQYTEAAAKHRTTAAAARTEQARRADMAKRHPELYDIETKARRSYAVQQKRAAAEQSRARAQESAGYHRTPPNQGRGGPSAGRR
ncbi:hypothetical protein R2B67_00170 [Streptomyces cyaneofuscatus]|uniref:hypothetical protein n=1 Tax=Streptomyces cyaneofuscatus TaxID=66883 RepID=UPI00295379E9|nr:hypothetical protein [Streptomyces cyaneofuscatus]WOP07045.1 hypothetical protein R2B67_00170 [Streptomyces cyaneofuscatus]